MVILLIFGIVVLKLAGQPVVMGITAMREILPFIGPLSFGLFADFNSLEFLYIGEIYICLLYTSPSPRDS